MIGRLRGILIEKDPPLLVIDVNGVGYEVLASMSTFYQLPDINNQITLRIQMIVREDSHLLYGFYQEQERRLFRSLIKVNGVGPKLALTILSGIESDQFIRCVQRNDSSSLVKIPGVGKKTAERLIVETRDALSDWQLPSSSTTETLTLKQEQDSWHDAISALTALGYKSFEAKQAVQLVSKPDLNNTEDLIRLALQQLAKSVR